MKRFTSNGLLTTKIAFSALLIMGFMSCDRGGEPTPGPGGTDAAITLACNHFTANPNTVLKDNPNAPIDYIITCKMAISDDVIIEPGVTIMFLTDAGLSINGSGSLKAAGTADKKITFTGETKTMGAWAGIYYETNSLKNEMSHTIVEYAGGDKFNSNNDRAGVIFYANSMVKFNNNLLQYNENFGITLNYGGIKTSIENNSFKNNSVPIRVKGELIDVIKSSNTFEANGVNKVEVRFYTSELKSNSTWRRLDVPYYTVSGSLSKSMSIEADLIIEPGVIIEMGAGMGLHMDNVGSIRAIGTAEQPIIIRGIEPLAGYWRRIEISFNSNPLNEFKYVNILHAGANPLDSKGAIYMWAKPKLKFSHVNFSKIASCAFSSAPLGANPNLTVSDITYSEVGGEICVD